MPQAEKSKSRRLTFEDYERRATAKNSNSKTADPKITNPKATNSKSAPKPKPTPPSPPPAPLPKYRIEDFIIPAHDAEGDSIPFTFRVDKRWYAAVQQVVQQGAWKYATPGQVMRHALLRHFEWLNSLEPGVMTGTLADIAMVREIVNEGQKIAEMADLIRHFETVIGKLMGHQLRGSAAQIAYRVRKKAGRFEDLNLRKYFLEQIETKFGYLFKSSGNGVDLAAVAADTEIDLSEIQLHESYDWRSGKDGLADEEEDVELGVEDNE